MAQHRIIRAKVEELSSETLYNIADQMLDMEAKIDQLQDYVEALNAQISDLETQI